MNSFQNRGETNMKQKFFTICFFKSSSSTQRSMYNADVRRGTRGTRGTRSL